MRSTTRNSAGWARIGAPTLRTDRWWLSPLLVFPVIGGFRLTCDYYREAGYRAFPRSPAACAVRESAARYRGESAFPLVLQNSHRYLFRLASVLLLTAMVIALMINSARLS